MATKQETKPDASGDGASASGDTVFLSDKVQNALTTIDSVPSKEQIDFAFDNSPSTALTTLADLSADESAFVGIRLRAIHALANYCTVRTSCVASDVAHRFHADGRAGPGGARGAARRNEPFR